MARMDRPPISCGIEFWSSTEVAAFQTALARELRAAGWTVAERFVVPQGEYWNARTRWQRWRMRIRSYGLYPARLHRHLRRLGEPTVSVVCSNTFYAPWVATRAARPATRVVHWVFDLFPEVLLFSGWLRPGGLGERVLRRVVRRSFDRAAANVFLGENLRRYAERKFGPIPRSHVIAIGADGAPFRDAEPARTVRTDRGEVLTLLYCGNMGRMHDFATFAAAVPRVAGLPLRFQLRGNGPERRGLEARTAHCPHVSFGPNLEAEEWAGAMKDAGVALVFLKEVAGGLVMPSKTFSALVAGQAVLAVCPRDSDLAALILKHDAGWVVAPGDVDGLVQVLQHLAAAPDEVLQKRRNAWRAGHGHYEQGMLAKQWVELFRQVLAAEEAPA